MMRKWTVAAGLALAACNQQPAPAPGSPQTVVVGGVTYTAQPAPSAAPAASNPASAPSPGFAAAPAAPAAMPAAPIAGAGAPPSTTANPLIGEWRATVTGGVCKALVAAAFLPSSVKVITAETRLEFPIRYDAVSTSSVTYTRGGAPKTVYFSDADHAVVGTCPIVRTR